MLWMSCRKTWKVPEAKRAIEKVDRLLDDHQRFKRWGYPSPEKPHLRHPSSLAARKPEQASACADLVTVQKFLFPVSLLRHSGDHDL
jgi:hypothetical protein